MLLAGDAIDSSVGFYLNCSVLASAAMGNVCSGLFGMQVHGLIDRAVQKLFRRLPTLTEAQLKNRRVFIAGQLGGTLGIMLGLILGMFPLLFIDANTNEKSNYAMFQR
uniref:Transmembrane protein 65 n=1 Tax=Lygus hesperus TaxID=30085 RepID=A0A0A9YQQ6_LYGHE